MLNSCKNVSWAALCTPFKCELLPSQSPLLPWNNATQRSKILAGVGVWRWADWQEEEGMRKKERQMTAEPCGGGAPLNQQTFRKPIYLFCSFHGTATKLLFTSLVISAI